MKIKTGRYKVLLIILAIFIVLVISYYLLNPKKAINLILPGLNEISYIHIDLKKDSALVKLVVIVQNKMPYKMKIDTIHFEINLNSLRMVEETIPLQIDQSWFDTDTIELPLNISLKETKKITDILKGQDSTDMDINLYIIYKTLIGGQKIQINRKIRIESPIPPQITIKKIEQKNYDMKNKTSDAVLKIEIVNNGRNIDLQLNSINYKLQIKNNLFSKGIFAGPIHIRPASSLTVDIPITIEYNNPLRPG